MAIPKGITNCISQAALEAVHCDNEVQATAITAREVGGREGGEVCGAQSWWSLRRRRLRKGTWRAHAPLAATLVCFGTTASCDNNPQNKTKH